jgi:hypothetical protein
MPRPFGGFFIRYATARWMMIDGVDIIFIAPPLLLLLLAIVVGTHRFSKRGSKAAIMSVVRILGYGSLTLFILFIIWTVLYYAGGGH